MLKFKKANLLCSRLKFLKIWLQALVGVLDTLKLRFTLVQKLGAKRGVKVGVVGFNKLQIAVSHILEAIVFITPKHRKMILEKASKCCKFGLVFLGADFDVFFKFFKFLFIIV